MNDTEKKLLLYLSGELSEAESQAFEELMAEDQMLEASLEEQKQLDSLLSELPVYRPKADAVSEALRASASNWAFSLSSLRQLCSPKALAGAALLCTAVLCFAWISSYPGAQDRGTKGPLPKQAQIAKISSEKDIDRRFASLRSRVLGVSSPMLQRELSDRDSKSTPTSYRKRAPFYGYKKRLARLSSSPSWRSGRRLGKKAVYRPRRRPLSSIRERMNEMNQELQKTI